MTLYNIGGFDMNKKLGIRWLYLTVGTVAMLFAGILYAWSILKIPFADIYGWTAGNLSLNFTLTMSCFCIGGLVGAKLAGRLGHKWAIIIAGILGALGFVGTSLIGENQLLLLYITYGIVAGGGIGIAYNVILSTVNPWFPDKKGLCSGFLMMGFGASALVLGNLTSSLFESDFGWKNTYILLGCALGVVLILAGIILKKPDESITLPSPKRKVESDTPDVSPKEMLKKSSFYLAFIYLVFLTAVGNSVISFARDFALDVGATAAVATTLVGVLSVCNGLGRIITGACFDRFGTKATMTGAAILTIGAAGVTLISLLTSSVPLCVVGLCLTGLSYGTSPTTASTFTLSFYGKKHFSTNMAIMVFNMMGSSMVATLCGSILGKTGSFVVPFILLLSLAAASFVINLFIRK